MTFPSLKVGGCIITYLFRVLMVGWQNLEYGGENQDNNNIRGNLCLFIQFGTLKNR